MAIKTAEELQRLKELTQGAGLNAQVVPPEQIADPLTGTPVAATVAPTPVAAPTAAPPVIDPHAAAAPYNKQALDNSTQAAKLRTDAMAPAPEPQGAKENIVVGLRNALENMGRYGAPGGYYGQEEQRSQDYQKQQAVRLSQAKDLQDISEKQQGLGINAENVARQENYNQGQLAETTRLRQQQEAVAAETARHNTTMEGIEQNKPLKGAPGDMFFKPGGGDPIASVPAKPTQLRHVILQNTSTNKPEVWSIDANSQPVEKVGDAPAGTGAGALQLAQSTDGNGNAVYTIVDKANATARAVKAPGGDTALQTSDLGKANAKDDAKAAADFDSASKSLTAMEKLMQQSEANPNGAYPSDQAMADAFFNIIKPGSGARMNETQINRIITPGPLKDKMIVWAQKLSSGAPFDTQSRRDLYNSAKTVVESKRPKPRALAPINGKTTNGGWSVQVVQ